MLIEPRKAEKGALSRWVRQSWVLMHRHLEIWLAITTAGAVTVLLGYTSHVISWVFAYTLLLLTMKLASVLDSSSRISYLNLLKFLKSIISPTLVYTFLGIVPYFLFGKIALTLITDGGMDDLMVGIYRSDGGIIPKLTSVYSLLLILSFGLVLLICLSVFFMILPMYISPYEFMIISMFGCEKQEAKKLASKGIRLNIWYILQILLLQLIIVLPISYYVPLVPMLVFVPLIGCVLWVSFKDIFLHSTELTEWRKAGTPTHSAESIPNH